MTYNPSSDVFLLLGVLLFCAGTLLGIPHGRSKRRGDLERTELWRVAHLSTCVGGVAVIALTVALERLVGDAAIYTLTLFSAAAYCFFVACSLSGYLCKSWDGDRTLPSVKLIYGLQIIASALSVGAVGVTLIGLLLKGLY